MNFIETDFTLLLLVYIHFHFHSKSMIKMEAKKWEFNHKFLTLVVLSFTGTGIV